MQVPSHKELRQYAKNKTPMYRGCNCGAHSTIVEIPYFTNIHDYDNAYIILIIQQDSWKDCNCNMNQWFMVPAYEKIATDQFNADLKELLK